MIHQGPLSGLEPRWLDPDTAAAYIRVRVERLRPMVRAGKIPPPSYHLGPNQPRYDRLALDKVFEGGHGNGQASNDARTAAQALATAIIQGKGRAARPGRRHD